MNHLSIMKKKILEKVICMLEEAITKESKVYISYRLIKSF